MWQCRYNGFCVMTFDQSWIFNTNIIIFKIDIVSLPVSKRWEGLSWLWSYGSWIYNYLCSQCLSPLMLWIRISIRARCTLCQWLVTGRWFSPGSPVSSTNKTDHHVITEILLKVSFNAIKQTNNKRWVSECSEDGYILSFIILISFIFCYRRHAVDISICNDR
jgi:hypothetical protein